ncbi:hypothetical protein EV644_1231 [Kribbella orskensis]|uniref:Uncharacterized protein n=1 Tax=Kribbella orskensis TaxID=2512216 RepID=A0ABY2B9V1_9ACTN|nr:hypothetical protein EV642_125122 [Kribbella sp. VKM Ac-2500]TCO13169.1 hypothetical protein EV644_1231 [Kribbella orskensis]
MNKEIKRRTDVVGVFANPSAPLRASTSAGGALLRVAAIP